jgi:hypothetical protein
LTTLPLDATDPAAVTNATATLPGDLVEIDELARGSVVPVLNHHELVPSGSDHSEGLGTVHPGSPVAAVRRLRRNAAPLKTVAVAKARW